MVAVLERAAEKMSEPKDATGRTGNYRLYRATMDRLVEIAAFKKTSVAELCEPVLAALADAEYMAMLNEKLAAEKERQKLILEMQKKKRPGS